MSPQYLLIVFNYAGIIAVSWLFFWTFLRPTPERSSKAKRQGESLVGSSSASEIEPLKGLPVGRKTGTGEERSSHEEETVMKPVGEWGKDGTELTEEELLKTVE